MYSASIIGFQEENRQLMYIIHHPPHPRQLLNRQIPLDRKKNITRVVRCFIIDFAIPDVGQDIA